MPRKLQTLVVVLLVALLPLRAVAAVTIGLCAMGQQEAPAAHSGCEEQRPAEPSHQSSSCGICVEHCSSAAFVLPAAQSVAERAIAEESVPPAERVAPAFFPDHLDRPPLA